MKKHPFSVVASCVITRFKVSWKPRNFLHTRETSAPSYILYTYIIYKYNDAMTQSPVFRGLVVVIICVMVLVHPERRTLQPSRIVCSNKHSAFAAASNRCRLQSTLATI